MTFFFFFFNSYSFYLSHTASIVGIEDLVIPFLLFSPNCSLNASGFHSSLNACNNNHIAIIIIIKLLRSTEPVLSATFWFRSCRYVFTDLHTSLGGEVFRLQSFYFVFSLYVLFCPATSESLEALGDRLLEPTLEILQAIGVLTNFQGKVLGPQVWEPLGRCWGRTYLKGH